MPEVVGALSKAPAWVLDISPFHHVAPWPAVPVNGGAAVGLLVIAAAGVGLAVLLLARRDIAPG